MDHHRHDDHDRGLQFDVATVLKRRRMLGLLAGAGLVAVAGCDTAPGAAPNTGSSAGSSASAGSSGASATCATEIAQETAGPYPGDGSNGPNVLTRSGIVRGDIRSSFGTASGVAKGVPLTINLAILDVARGCAAYAGAAVYLWQCDMAGGYSMYSRGIANENYLRGVQEADGSGMVRFTSIFPGAYSGRWPHIHFEVYPTLAKATATGNRITTSQLALPEAACTAVYATGGYDGSAQNLARTSLTSDTVFRDGTAGQLATVTGDVTTGLVANLSIPVLA
jgi:protocatechuate 3,4-dioxygenase beta subunit